MGGASKQVPKRAIWGGCRPTTCIELDRSTNKVPGIIYIYRFIAIKGVLFFPLGLQLQYLPGMLLIMRMLGDSCIPVFGPKIAPICLCATLAPQLVLWFLEDQLVLKGIVTYCLSTTLLDILYLPVFGPKGAMLGWLQTYYMNRTFESCPNKVAGVVYLYPRSFFLPLGSNQSKQLPNMHSLSTLISHHLL